MDTIKQARLLYRKHQEDKYSLSEEDKDELDAKIKRFIYIGIKGITPVSKLFVFTQILDILKHVLRILVLSNRDVRPLGKAFDVLETYFNLLVDQPWKPEFKKLKTYGGFYRTKLKSVLPEPETIFRIAGYEEDLDNHLLVLRKPAEKDVLLSLAFDCHLAASQCHTIEQQHKKLKALDKTLGDAISDVLHDPTFASLAPKQKPAAPALSARAAADAIVLPPLIPMKEPHMNGHATDTSLPTKQLIVAPGSRQGPVLPARSGNGRQDAMVTMAPSLHTLPPDAHVSVEGQKSSPVPPTPQALSVHNHTSLLGMTDPHNEVLQVHPEGTSENHMRESLKMQTNPRSTVSEPSFRPDPTIGDVAWWGSSPYNLTRENWNRIQAATYPPGFAYTKNQGHVNSINPPSIDEGIGSELSPISKPSIRYHQMPPPVQSVLPNKMPTSYPQPLLSDLGYRTGSSMQTTTAHSQHLPSTSMSYSYSTAVPTQSLGIDTDGVGKPNNMGIQMRPKPPFLPDSASVTLQGGGGKAPPVPPRDLKPLYQHQHQRLAQLQAGEDAVDGAVFTNASNNVVTERPDNENIEASLRRNAYSMYGNIDEHVISDYCDKGSANGARSHPYPLVTPAPTGTVPDTANADQMNLRRSLILSASRGGSLKTTGENSKSPLAQVVAQSRVTRSMDFAHKQWQCRSCTAINVASDAVCCVCARSRSAMVASEQAPGQTGGGKNCPSCTFENMPEKTHCEMCNGELYN